LIIIIIIIMYIKLTQLSMCIIYCSMLWPVKGQHLAKIFV
jgi:hypothetical protein